MGRYFAPPEGQSRARHKLSRSLATGSYASNPGLAHSAAADGTRTRLHVPLPACNQSRIFKGWLTVVPECVVCGAPLGRYRADDAPPYFVIFAVGHVVIPLLFLMETNLHPPLWVHAAIWLPVSLTLAAVLLRPIKGATLGLMLKLGMVKADDE